MDQSGLAATLGTVDKRDGTCYEKVKSSHKARGANRLTGIFGQILLDCFLGLCSIFPNLCNVREFQGPVVSRRERRGVLFQPLEETVLLKVEPVEYLRLHHPNTDGVEYLLLGF